MHLSSKIPVPSLGKWSCTADKNARDNAQIAPIEIAHEEDTFEKIADINNEVKPLYDSDDEIPYPESPIVYNGGQYLDVEDYFYNNDGKYFEKALRPEKKPKAPQPRVDANLLNELHIAMHGAKDPEVVKMEEYLKEINKQSCAPLRPERP
jgi:hypothetical protein